MRDGIEAGLNGHWVFWEEGGGGWRRVEDVEAAVKGGLAGSALAALRLGQRHASRLLQPLGHAAALRGCGGGEVGGGVGLTSVRAEGAGSDKAHQHV